MVEKKTPVVYVTPDALLYLMDKEMSLILTSAGESRVNAVAGKVPGKSGEFAFTNQDGIRIYYPANPGTAFDRQVVVDVKKKIFSTSLYATVRDLPTGGGFMGSRCGK